MITMDNDYLIARTDGPDRKSYAVLNPDPNGRVYAVEVTKYNGVTDIGIVPRCMGPDHHVNEFSASFAQDFGFESCSTTLFLATKHLREKRGLSHNAVDATKEQECNKAELWSTQSADSDEKLKRVIEQLRSNSAISSDDRVRVGVAKTVEALLADTPNLEQLSSTLDRIAQASATSRPPIERQA